MERKNSGDIKMVKKSDYRPSGEPPDPLPRIEGGERDCDDMEIELSNAYVRIAELECSVPVAARPDDVIERIEGLRELGVPEMGGQSMVLRSDVYALFRSAATQTDRSDGLDVRRLIVAEHNVRWPGQPHDFNGPDPIFGDNDCACDGVEVAAEYARLATPASIDATEGET